MPKNDLLGCCAGVLALVALPAAAFAQQAPAAQTAAGQLTASNAQPGADPQSASAPQPAADTQPPDQGSTGEDAGVLQQVVVTAQRRRQEAQSVPIAIAAFTGATLDRMQITNTTQLSDFVPGLNVSRANVGAVPYLRGVGNFTATPGNEAAIATYVDGVYYPAAGASNYFFNNIDHIEVLKGPQGTLFGRNAAGGVISVVTKDPGQTPALDLQAGYGNYNTGTLNLYAAGPLSDVLAADIAAYGQYQGTGWGKNLFDNTQAYLSYDEAVRSKWVLRPNDRNKVTFTMSLQHLRNDQASASNLIPGSVSLGGYTHFGGFYDVDTNFDGYAETVNYDFSLTAEHDMSWATLKSISAWEDSHWVGIIENDSSPANIQEARLNSGDRTATEELQLASPESSRIVWIGGLYFYLDNAYEWPFTQYGNVAIKYPGDEQLTYSNQHTKSYAAYGQATYPITDDTRVTLGLRYTQDDRSVAGHRQTLADVVLLKAAQSASADAVTYRAALDHNFTKTVLGYISYNRGFKSGNFNPNSPNIAPTKPEFLDAYEMGLKSDLLHERLRVNTAAYYYQFHDLQVQQQLITGTLQTNAAKARYYGLDLDIQAVLAATWTMQASLNAESAKYTSFPNAIFNRPAPTGLGYVQYTGDASGIDVPYADPFTASVNSLWRFLPQWEWMLGVAYHDGFPFDISVVHQPAYWMTNTALTWTAASSNWDIKVWGQNLFNKEWYAQQQVSPVGWTYSPGNPRTYGITFDYHL
jgi:iron complex outermembrane recepter protein